MAAYDPVSITDVENFMSEAWDHAAIKAALDTMDTRTTSQIAATWSTHSGDAVEAMNAFAAAFRREIPTNWSGTAATAVQNRVEEYSATRLNVATQLGGVATSLFTAIDAVAALKSKIAAPAELSSVQQYEAMLWSGDPRSAAEHAEEAQARADMQALYAPAYQHTDSNVPSFDPPPAFSGTPASYTGPPPSQGAGSPAPSPIGGISPIGSSAPTEGQAGIPETASGTPADNLSVTDPAATDPAATAPASAMPASTVPSSAGTGMGSEGSQPRSWMQSANDPSSSGSRAGSGGFGGPVGGGGYGGGGRSAGGNVPRGGGFGAPVNAGASSAGGGVSQARGAGTASTRGMGGMGMAGMGGARGQGDDDKEHQTPDYLINIDNGNELIGTLPLVAPPVIGG